MPLILHMLQTFWYASQSAPVSGCANSNILDAYMRHQDKRMRNFAHEVDRLPYGRCEIRHDRMQSFSKGLYALNKNS